MSLINDALKRANQSQKQPVRPRPPLAAMQPVEHIRRPAAWPSYVVPGLLVVVLAMAGWFLHAWWQSRQNQTTPVAALVLSTRPAVPIEQSTTAVPIPSATPLGPAVPTANIKVNTNLVVRANPPTRSAELSVVEATKPAAVDAQVVGNSPLQPAVIAPETKTTANPSPTAPATNAPVAVPEKTASKPVFPEIKLQGIFYRVAKPSVLINSRTLFINDKVDGVKVIAIGRQSVTLEFEAERRVLTLD